MSDADRALPSMPSHEQLQQAAHWYACLRDGQACASERAAWQTWLAAAEGHALAWQQVQEISRAFEPVRALPNVREAAEGLQAANQRMRVRRRVLASCALLTTGGLAGALSWRQGWLPDQVMAWGADAHTHTGELKQMRLADGSTLWLNTGSAVDVRFGASERRLVLLAGEVFVTTAHDARPLLVQTTDGQMRALGTRFNVQLGNSATELTVFEGAVEVCTTTSGSTLVVAAGQRTRFTRARIEQPDIADSARQAWTQGRLIANNLPLREFVVEMRRYRKGYLGVADAVADLEVYGSFPAQDSDRALKMLSLALPVRIEQRLPWWTSIEAKA
ncbi:FecR domain-containing protein [Comamonas testosteroni]